MTDYILYAVLFAGIMLSGSLVLFLKISPKNLKLILAFSGAYLLAITVMHLIPEIYVKKTAFDSTDVFEKLNIDWKIGLFILAGFLLQIFIEYFSEGIEHGHIHIHKDSEKTFPLTVMLALSIHSFIEGMPLAGELNETKRSLASGIIFHNVPIAIALMSMLLQSGQKKTGAMVWLMIFALMTPLGALCGNMIETISLTQHSLEEHSHLMPQYTNYIMAVVVGIFLHVSTTILFESSDGHRFHFIKLAVILAGMGLAIAT